MTQNDRIYLDHAATSWPKPESVFTAMDDCARQVGASAGRGSYRSANLALSHVQSARREIGRLIGASTPDCISLHCSGTAALNAAIHGLIRPGDHVVTTAAEHNSVLRPLEHLRNAGMIDVATVPCDRRGGVLADQIIKTIRADTSMVVVTHASNVTGFVQPIDAIASALRDHRAMFVVDAAQTLGYLPIDVTAIPIDVLAAPGHKGLHGPLGTGLLYLREELHAQLRPLIQGGTGSKSQSLAMPEQYPAKSEAGNLNVPALAGLTAAVRHIQELERDTIGQKLRSLSLRLHSNLENTPGVHLQSTAGDLVIASLQVAGASPHDVAAILDSEYGIETRSGFHCAALIHKYLGCEQEGTLRISGGPTTTDEDIDIVCDAIKTISRQLAAV
ncbi:MAG: aminotransferase class V-fold PLP-dependent enzyme [Pirellulaceae bacterium]|nr:aminotransferase class V-fold PLP-dependent enzyme [Pirellulaceae bacterium]